MKRSYKMNENNFSVGIIGTGNIGSSLAALFTGNGYKTVVFGVDSTQIEQGKLHYKIFYDELEQRELINSRQRIKCAENLSYTSDYADLKDVKIVFESAFEDLQIKYQIYSEIEKHCGNLVALASTTSAMSPEDLQKGLKNYPQKAMVAHPFNPPHLVPFVELVKSEKTSEEAAKAIYDFLESCGRKVCVMKKSAPGFIANRLQHALLREAMYMVDEGMTDARDIDKALQYSFMPRYTAVGLFEHQDAFGLDMVQNVQNYMFPYLCDCKKSANMVDNCIDKGAFGQKSGKGTYKWSPAEIEDFKRRAAEPYWKYFNWNLPDSDTV